MSNLVLTRQCNRHCEYCFAADGAESLPMTVGEAEHLLDLAVASGNTEVRLLGGEPTVHADFPRILQAAIDRGLKTRVFSNGLMPPKALAAILAAPAERCFVMLNLNVGSTGGANDEAVSGTAAALGPRGSVGVNIYRPDLPLREAFEFARAHSLAPVIRLGLAHPRLDRHNSYLHPRHYPQVGEEIERLYEVLAPAGFSLSFDCGFVPCMFRPEFLEALNLQPSDLGRRCNPIPDLLPGGTATHCFPLGELDQVPISGAASFRELRDVLTRRTEYLRAGGIYRDCEVCALRTRGDCLGGCLSAMRLRAAGAGGNGGAGYHPAHPRADGGAGYHPAHRRAATTAGRVVPGPSNDPAGPSGDAASPRLWTIPYVDLPLEFWQSLGEDFGPSIREVYFPLGLPPVGSGRPPQPNRHLAALLAAPPLPPAVLVNPIVLPGPLDEVAPAVLDELARLHEEYGVAAATLSDVRLAERVRARLPALRLTASCLLEVTEPAQAQTLNGLFEVLVPATRLLRRPHRLAALRAAFSGRLRLLVNEGCLHTCLERRQHFYEMATASGAPASLCAERLAEAPWLRLTGAWVLPQHLDLVAPLADEYKLAGRVTLREGERYRQVLSAYVRGRALWPHEIGGGPASPLSPCAVSRTLAEWLQQCDQVCGECRVCRRAWSAERPV